MGIHPSEILLKELYDRFARGDSIARDLSIRIASLSMIRTASTICDRPDSQRS